MIMSTILGMGVPGVAAYVIVQAVAVPVLIDVNVLPISAHMFCLIYACLSNICLLYTSPSPRDRSVSRMPSSA